LKALLTQCRSHFQGCYTPLTREIKVWYGDPLEGAYNVPNGFSKFLSNKIADVLPRNMSQSATKTGEQQPRESLESKSIHEHVSFAILNISSLYPVILYSQAGNQ
jgi:hypothetical protein